MFSLTVKISGAFSRNFESIHLSECVDFLSTIKLEDILSVKFEGEGVLNPEFFITVYFKSATTEYGYCRLDFFDRFAKEADMRFIFPTDMLEILLPVYYNIIVENLKNGKELKDAYVHSSPRW